MRVDFMKILVIFTGGTIGTSIKNGWADIDANTKYMLLNGYNNKDNIEFVTASPYSTLSENLSAKHLNLLQKEIADNIIKDFDGIIVTHGTDTLQYSATAIEYAYLYSSFVFFLFTLYRNQGENAI